VSRTWRLVTALGLNLALVVGQLVFGVAAHSLGLISDAGHNLADVAAVLTALVAVRYARRAATASRSFGYHRGTILAALVNAGAILAVTLLIVYGAVDRLGHPVQVRAGVMVVVGLTACLVNTAAALVLYERGKHDLNMRSALLHMGGDALASLGVAAVGVVILATGGFYWLDPVVSLGIAALIAAEAFRLVRQAVDVLLESTPADLDVQRVSAAMTSVEGVDAVHDLHVWSLSSEVRALSAHLVLSGHPTLEEAQVVGELVKARIGGPFAIAHTTLELECEPCPDGTEDRCAMDAFTTAGRAPGADRAHAHRGRGARPH
jgi:cobalt-zinc-cadmium efflux system protein